MKEDKSKAFEAKIHDHDANEEIPEDDHDVLVLTLDDDSTVECHVLEIFSYDDQEYIALLAEDDEDGKILLYRYEDGDLDDEVELSMIEDEDKFEEIAQAFVDLMNEDEEDSAED